MLKNKTPHTALHQRDERRRSPSAERNREFICDVLKEILPNKGLVLEIASGTGDHAAWIGPQLAPLIWQTSEFNTELFPSICSHIAHTKADNILSPIHIDVAQQGWALEKEKSQELTKNIDVITCVNMVHITPWEATLGLLSGAQNLLKENGALYLYGPFIQDHLDTAPSNTQFDASLRQRDDKWGIRRLEIVQQAAEANDFILEKTIPMPANNLSLIFRKVS
ncbi:MAG: DUF938 domain-containing protein [Halopseudomonas aestusnigri]